MGKTKCTFCKKKLGMISFDCSCGGIFCSTHLNRHSHNCPCIEKEKVDEKKKIEKLNPKTEFTKVEKI